MMPRSGSRIRRAWILHGRNASVLLAALILTGTIIFVYFTITGRLSWLALTALTLAGATQVIIRYFAPRETLETMTVSTKRMDEATELGELIVKSYAMSLLPCGDQALSLYGEILARPASYRVRTIEHIELNRGRTERTGSVNFEFSEAARRPEYQELFASGDGSIFLPILVPRKGKLYDQEKIVDSTGTIVHPIAYNKAIALNVALLRFTFTNTYDLPAIFEDWEPHYRWHFVDIIKQVTATVQGALALEEIQNSLTRFRSQRQASDNQFNRLVTLVGTLSERYAVVARVHPTQNFSVTYCQSVRTRNMSRKIPDDDSTSFTRFTQAILGINSGYVTLEIPQARITQSYHLHLNVPSGSYIGRAMVVVGGSEILANRHPERTVTIPYLRPIHLERTALHLYGRGLGFLPGSVRVEGRIYERPWGTELFGAISCAALVVLDLILRNSFISGNNSDALAVSLALPVAIATVGAFFSAAIRRSFTASTTGILGGIVASAGTVLLVGVFALSSDQLSTAAKVYRHSAFWDWSVATTAAFALLAVAAFGLRAVRYVANIARR